MGAIRLEIRCMIPSDYDQVYELWLRTPGVGLNSVDDSREGITRYLLRNPETCFVALRGHTVIGVILSGHDGRRGYVYHMAVDVEERRQGIGDRLLASALNALRAQGIAKIALLAFRKNGIGNSFWDKKGFSIRDDVLYRDFVLMPGMDVRPS